jgi:hypothetical protein
MAEIIELQEDQGNLDSLQQAEQQEPTQDVDTSSEPAYEPPEKYKGKALEEIIRMHQEAEKLIGRQAQEVGESRKLLDEVIKQQLNTQKNDAQPSKQQEIDWFEDPAKAVNQAVENNPVLKQLQEQQEHQAKAVALQTIEKQHPDFMSVAQSEDFAQWIQGSKVRMQLFAQANNYDVDSALELLENYKSIKGVQAQQTQAAHKATEEAMKKTEVEARTKTLKAAGVQQGGSGEVTKPVYRRTDLIRLKMTDPQRYMDMEADILQAYAEHRVK